MRTTKAPSGKTLVVSSQKENYKPLASEINVMSFDKGKNPKQLGDKKKQKNNKKKQESSTHEKSSKKPTRQKKSPPFFPCLICNEEHYTRDFPH